MTVISYAQNYEDIMLWRALKNVENGFYIDVGAAWPTFDSVTRLFYDHGWRGINIEPNPELHSQLQVERLRDINLCFAISDQSGNQTMNFLNNHGLSTLDHEIAQRHVQAGWQCDQQNIQVKTLEEVWKDSIPVATEVHFLKIDVEGLEKAVLKGNNWLKNRPWIVVIEATLPMTQTQNHLEWEPILTDANYKFVYSDGINRFYVSHEHSELSPRFTYPPNYFDFFIHCSDRNRLDLVAQDMIGQVKQSHDELTEELKAMKHNLEQKLQELSEQLIRRSWSGFLKRASYLWCSFWKSALHRTKQELRPILVRAIKFILLYPALRQTVTRVLAMFPKVRIRIKKIFLISQGIDIDPDASDQFIDSMQVIEGTKVSDFAALTPTARYLYAKLVNVVVQLK